MSDIHIYPEKSGSGGTGPEDDPQYAARSIRVNGFSVLAFGLALAITFLIFFSLVSEIKPPADDQTKNEIVITDNEFILFMLAIDAPNWLSYLLYGFFTGILIAAIYNFLVVKRLNLWGVESSVD